jgi:ATP phosphoribosyltransferase
LAEDVADGVADFALLGSDKYGELARPDGFCYEPVGKLACRFVLAAPHDQAFKLEAPLRVATSYPNALGNFLGACSLNACLGPIRQGKVEGAVGLGIADAIFDICETCASLAANNLEILAEGEPLELGGLWRRED